MTDIDIALAAEEETAALGARLAVLLRRGDIIGLSGPLGAGKTTLARGLVKALLPAEETPSPTFALAELYEAPHLLLWHFDLYRLEKPDDVWELGLEDAFAEGAALIEWPERIAAFLPASMLLVRLDLAGGQRRAVLRGGGDWPSRLNKAGF